MKVSLIFIYRVSNVTHFGAFVDVGLGKVIINRLASTIHQICDCEYVHLPFSFQNGLIHSSKMGKVVGKLEVQNTNLVNFYFVYWWLMPLSNIPGRRPGGGQSSKYWYCQRKNRAWSCENDIEGSSWFLSFLSDSGLIVAIAQCVLWKAYFSGQPNKLRPILRFEFGIPLKMCLSQLVRVCGKYICSHFCDFETLDTWFPLKYVPVSSPSSLNMPHHHHHHH